MWQIEKHTKNGWAPASDTLYEKKFEAECDMRHLQDTHKRSAFRLKYVMDSAPKPKKQGRRRTLPTEIAPFAKNVKPEESCITPLDTKNTREDTLDDNCKDWAQLY